MGYAGLTVMNTQDAEPLFSNLKPASPFSRPRLGVPLRRETLSISNNPSPFIRILPFPPTHDYLRVRW